MIKEFAARVFAGLIHIKNQKWIHNQKKAQEDVFKKLISKG